MCSLVSSAGSLEIDQLTVDSPMYLRLLNIPLHTLLTSLSLVLPSNSTSVPSSFLGSCLALEHLKVECHPAMINRILPLPSNLKGIEVTLKVPRRGNAVSVTMELSKSEKLTKVAVMKPFWGPRVQLSLDLPPTIESLKCINVDLDEPIPMDSFPRLKELELAGRNTCGRDMLGLPSEVYQTNA